MTLIEPMKAALVLFAAVLVQVSMLSAYAPFGGSADLVLVTLLSIALLRGSVFGAAAGFGAGLLFDVAHLETLGVTSLLLTVAGFWIGRYGETTARDRAHAPYTSVAVVTVVYAFVSVALRFVLGEPAPGVVLVSSLPATLVLNLLLTLPVYALVRRLFPPQGVADRVREVRLLG